MIRRVSILLFLIVSMISGSLLFVTNVKADSVPAPNPPESDYNIACCYWGGIYQQGEHYGWDLLQNYPDRKPLGVGWYDENDPEVWSWFNRWALNYGIKTWIFGCFKNTTGPIDKLFGEKAIDAFKASQFSDQMKYALYIHNASITDANEMENNIYPRLKANFQDPRYLVVNNRPVLWVITDYTFDAAKLNQLAQADGWDGVTLYNRYASPVLDGRSVYNEFCDGKGYGSGITIATASMGFAGQPWGTGRTDMRTPQEFEDHLRNNIKPWMDNSATGLGKTLCIIDNWCEFGEGHWVCPTNTAGFGYLDAVRKVFTSGGSLPGDILPTSPIQKIYDNPQAYWKFDETNGDVAYDSSIFGHNVTVNGAAWDPQGKSDGCLNFDGIDDHVLLAEEGARLSGFMHDHIGLRRVSMWFKADTTNGTRTLYEESEPDYGLALRINNGKLEAGIAREGNRSIISQSFTDTTDWHFVEIQYYGKGNWSGPFKTHGFELWLDNRLLERKFMTHAGSFLIGSKGAAAIGCTKGGDAFGSSVYDGSYFAGKIDDVKIRYTYGKKDFGGIIDAGGNLAASATVTADSQQAGYEKEKAVDGISNSDTHRWVSTGNTPNHWIQLEWGSEKSIGNVKVWSGSMAYPDNQLDDYTVQYWDGGAWQTVAAVTDNPMDGSSGQYNDLVFTAVNTTRIRLNITDPSHGTDNYARVLEIQAFGNLAASATVTADSQQTGYEKEKAVDGISNSDTHRWVSTGNTPNHWIQLEWGSEKSIGNVKVWSGSMAYPDNQLDDYTVQYWDGGAWQTVAAVTDNPMDGSSGQYNDLVFTAVNTTRIRLNITDPSHGTDNYARVLEIMAI